MAGGTLIDKVGDRKGDRERKLWEQGMRGDETIDSKSRHLELEAVPELLLLSHPSELHSLCMWVGSRLGVRSQFVTLNSLLLLLEQPSVPSGGAGGFTCARACELAPYIRGMGMHGGR